MIAERRKKKIRAQTLIRFCSVMLCFVLFGWWSNLFSFCSTWRKFEMVCRFQSCHLWSFIRDISVHFILESLEVAFPFLSSDDHFFHHSLTHKSFHTFLFVSEKIRNLKINCYKTVNFSTNSTSAVRRPMPLTWYQVFVIQFAM